MVYLIHFDKPLAHAQHYIGFTDNLDNRLHDHAHHNGAKILQAVQAAGIGYKVVRTWEGDRKLERQLKNQKNSSRLCPVCMERRKVDEKAIKSERKAANEKVQYETG